MLAGMRAAALYETGRPVCIEEVQLSPPRAGRAGIACNNRPEYRHRWMRINDSTSEQLSPTTSSWSTLESGHPWWETDCWRSARAVNVWWISVPFLWAACDSRTPSLPPCTPTRSTRVNRAEEQTKQFLASDPPYMAITDRGVTSASRPRAVVRTQSCAPS